MVAAAVFTILRPTSRAEINHIILRAVGSPDADASGQKRNGRKMRLKTRRKRMQNGTRASFEQPFALTRL